MAEFLLDVFNRVAAAGTLDDKLETIVEITTSVLGAERGTLFLNDQLNGELYSRVAQGDFSQEIRILNTSGVAGYVYTTGRGVIIHNAYSDERFDPSVDEKTGFITKSILCTPIKTVRGETLGVIQALNKTKGEFDQEDLKLLNATTTQASVFLQSALLVEQMEKARRQEAEFLGVVSEVSSEIQLGPLLQKIMAAVTKMLNAERSTLFLNDEKTDELYTEIGQGLGATKIRFPNHLGIAGTVFKSRESVNIPHAYADLRFNPSFDKETGFFTRSILCVPVTNKDGKTIGVTQVLNRLGGPFTENDEARLKAFTAQISIGLENAKLFSDIRGFTTLTEELGAQGTVALLNEYFTIMVDCIQQEGGMLDKFIGDAIMAIFGTPFPHGDDEDRSVRAAIAMLTELAVYNQERKDHGKLPIEMGVGINTGIIVSGNIGSPKRMDFTVIGDGVNLAARLESACKQYAARLLISENTFKKLRGIYQAREIDLVVVKGKTEPVAVYELIDYHTEETFPNLMEVMNHFKDGLNKYRQGNWEKSVDAFQEALSLHSDDRISQIYIDRCRHYMDHPPPEDWGGGLDHDVQVGKRGIFYLPPTQSASPDYA